MKNAKNTTAQHLRGGIKPKNMASTKSVTVYLEPSENLRRESISFEDLGVSASDWKKMDRQQRQSAIQKAVDAMAFELHWNVASFD